MAWARHGHGMASVNQTRPHCVTQMGKTHSKPLTAWNDRGTSWTQHGHGILSVNRPLDVSLSSPRRGFDRRRVHIRFVVDRVALIEVLLRALRFFPVVLNPPVLRTHIHVHVAFTRRTNGRSPENFHKANLFRK